MWTKIPMNDLMSNYGVGVQKTISTNKDTVETAVAIASLDFNMSPTGFGKVL